MSRADLDTRDQLPSRPGRAVPKLERVLCADLRRDWTAPEMAQAISLSQRTLTRRLKSEAGLSAMTLPWKVRVRQRVAPQGPPNVRTPDVKRRKPRSDGDRRCRDRPNS